MRIRPVVFVLGACVGGLGWYVNIGEVTQKAIAETKTQMEQTGVSVSYDLKREMTPYGHNFHLRNLRLSSGSVLGFEFKNMIMRVPVYDISQLVFSTNQPVHMILSGKRYAFIDKMTGLIDMRLIGQTVEHFSLKAHVSDRDNIWVKIEITGEDNGNLRIDDLLLYADGDYIRASGTVTRKQAGSPDMKLRIISSNPHKLLGKLDLPPRQESLVTPYLKQFKRTQTKSAKTVYASDFVIKDGQMTLGRAKLTLR